VSQVSYLSYWLGELLQLFAKDSKNMHRSLGELCAVTGIKREGESHMQLMTLAAWG